MGRCKGNKKFIAVCDSFFAECGMRGKASDKKVA